MSADKNTSPGSGTPLRRELVPVAILVTAILMSPLFGIPAFIVPFAVAFVALLLVSAVFPSVSVAIIAGVSAAAALMTSVIDTIGLLSALVATTLAVAATSSSRGILSNVALVLLSVLSVALALHIVPGFNNVLVVLESQVSPGAVTFEMYWNYDKLLVGLALMYVIVYRPHCLFDPILKTNRLAWIGVAILTIAVVLGAGWTFGAIEFDPKIPTFLSWWLFSNLLITCVAEEAFFRGILLTSAVQALDSIRHGGWIALLLVSALFGAVHIGGGIVYAAFSFVAGVGYGLVYLITGRVEASILTHFSLNLVHLLLFTYPILSTALPSAS